MSYQRDLFYGKMEEKSNKKGGRERNYRTTPQYLPGRFDPERVDIRFDNDTVTPYGGANLVKKFLRRFDLRKEFSQYIRIPKRRNGYRVVDLGTLLVDMKVLGLERLMHIETVREDPFLTTSYRLRRLPTGKTMGAYLKSYGQEQVRQLDYLNNHLNRRLAKKLRGDMRKRGIMLDYDSAVFTVYGKQEESARGYSFRKKDKPSFQPKFAFIGGLDIMVNQKLCPGNKNLDSDFMGFHLETLKKLAKGTKVKAVRGDSSIYSEENIEYFEGKKLLYGISAPLSGKLPGRIMSLREEDWVEGKDERGHPFSIARITYRPGRWKKARSFILSRRLKKDAQKQGYLFEGYRYKHFAYVTNKKGKLLSVFKFCVERCSLERCIKEAKLGFEADALPCMEFEANCAYLGHMQLAYNLMIYFKLLCLPPGANRWTVDTMRRRILLIPGNFKRVKKGWILHLPRDWHFQGIFNHIKLRLQCLEFA